VGGAVEHVDVAEAADCIVIAPATADLMARLVHGEAPDAVTAMVLASPAPLVVCPAMDLEMWRQPATQANVAALRSRGASVVPPETGPLASGLVGPGRLAGLEAIAEAVSLATRRRTSLAGVKVLVGAGRTEEPLDPVRVLTNRSSGRMGFALAAAARDRGASVTLVAGAASVEPPDRVRLLSAATASEMERAMLREARRADVVLMAAAVADYRPARPQRGKIERGEGPMTLELMPNRDILASIGRRAASWSRSASTWWCSIRRVTVLPATRIGSRWSSGGRAKSYPRSPSGRSPSGSSIGWASCSRAARAPGPRRGPQPATGHERAGLAHGGGEHRPLFEKGSRARGRGLPWGAALGERPRCRGTARRSVRPRPEQAGGHGHARAPRS